MPQQKSLTITSLNVARFLQPRTRAYLQSLGNTEPLPDVLCLQDIPFRDLSLLERWPHIAFAPMTNHLINGERAVVGIAMVSRYFMSGTVYCTTWGDGRLKDLQGVNDKNERYLGAESDALVEVTEDRLAICASINKDGVEYNIATTHGAWARGGLANDVQRQCTHNLIRFLSDKSNVRNGLILAGDMNFSRGGEIYRMFTDNGFCDGVPMSIDNTLDPEHPIVRKGVRIVTDYVMTHPGHHNKCTYRVTDVKLHSGVSDHCALLATVLG